MLNSQSLTLCDLIGTVQEILGLEVPWIIKEMKYIHKEKRVYIIICFPRRIKIPLSWIWYSLWISRHRGTLLIILKKFQYLTYVQIMARKLLISHWQEKDQNYHFTSKQWLWKWEERYRYPLFPELWESMITDITSIPTESVIMFLMCIKDHFTKELCGYYYSRFCRPMDTIRIMENAVPKGLVIRTVWTQFTYYTSSGMAWKYWELSLNIYRSTLPITMEKSSHFTILQRQTT